MTTKSSLTFCAALLATVTMTHSSQTMAEQQVAIFSGGCFWCMESDFEKLEGVNSVVSGYIGGHVPNPGAAAATNACNSFGEIRGNQG